MVVEIVELLIKTGQESVFEERVATAAPLFKKSKGCKAFSLRRSVERPGHYRLFVTWEHIDNHLVDFKNSPAIEEWRRLVGECHASPPIIEHFETTGVAFD